MPTIDVLFFRLILVLVIGGLIGIERELKTKSAGFRTIMLITVGSFLFTTFSMIMAPQTPDRIASNIVTGIGFLGAGVIFKSDNRVSGLTTAAIIWLTAALGMGVALGQYTFVLIATGLALMSLFVLVKMELWIDKFSQFKTYKISFSSVDQLPEYYETIIASFHLTSKRIRQVRDGNIITISWTIKGKEKNHAELTQALLKDFSIIKLDA